MGKNSPGKTRDNWRLYSVQNPYITNHMRTLIRVGCAENSPSTLTSSATQVDKREAFSGFRKIIDQKAISRRWHSKIRKGGNVSGPSTGRSSINLSQLNSSAEQQVENPQPKLNSISYNIYNGMVIGEINERKMNSKTASLPQDRGTFKDYSEQCTIHGLKYIGDSSLPKFERIFWMISVIVALCGAAFFIWHLYSKFTTSPIIISRAPESVSIEQIPFPALTICNMNNVKKSFADRVFQGTNQLDKFLVLDICDTRINTTLVPDEVKKEAGETALIDKFLPKATQSCMEMLYYCEWNSTEMNCTELFNAVYTDEGLCCNFNSVKRILWKPRIWNGIDLSWASDEHVDWNPEYVFKKSDPPSAIPWRGRGSGASHGLTLALDVNVDEYYCSSTASVGFKMLLHSPVESPQMREYGFTLSPGKETRVIITPHITDADDSIRKIPAKIRQCYFLNERRLRYYRVYTQKNCQLECEANFTMSMCHCMQYYMPVEDDTKICDQTDDACAARVKRILYDNLEEDDENDNTTLPAPRCRCYPGCYEIDYSTEISQSMLVATFKVGPKFLKHNSSYFERNIAIVHVFYVDSTYLKYRKNELYGFVELMSNTGGLLGLFMGFSLLSVTEIVYYVLLRMWTIIHKRRRKNAQNLDRNRDTMYPFTE